MSKKIIDVSAHQGAMNMEKAKKAGAAGVIIRCGYRGYESGKIATDPYYAANITKAEKAGLPVGIYWFTSAASVAEAEEEAKRCAELAKGHKLSFPVFLDLEYSTSARKGRADKLSARVRTIYAVAFLEKLQALGLEGGVYCNPDFWREALVPSALAHYPRWVARYGNSPSLECDLWQYTNAASGPKYGASSERIDVSLLYTDFTRGEKSRFQSAPAALSATGNPYPAPKYTVASNATAAALGLRRWIPQRDQVRAVQWELVRLKYQIGAVDGICGPKTTEAIKEFQRGAKLTVDGAAGPKTWAALVTAKEAPKIVVTVKVINYRKRAASVAKKVYPLCVGKVHSGAGVDKVVDLATLKKFKALSCNRMVSIALQEVGLLPKGALIKHTKKASGKKTVSDAATGLEKLMHCTVHWVNKKYADLPEEWQKAGVVYIQNSNTCMSAGGGKIWSCNKSKGYRYRGVGDYLRTGGYPFSSPILVVVVPDE